MFRPFFLAPALTAALIAAQPVRSEAAEMAPHEGEYAMNLKSTKQGSGVVGVKGRMIFRFADVCDGWTVENKTVMTMQQAEGEDVETLWRFLTWESKNGLNYRFRVLHLRDGEKVEEIEGSAQMEGPEGPGKAVLTKPESKTIPLPRGTMFPTAHTQLLLSEAAKGRSNFQRLVFDGSSIEAPQEVSALIGQAKSIGGKTGTGGVRANPLLARKSWPSHMAFYKPSAKDGLPSYEISLRYFENGIADEVVEDYGNFTLRSELIRLDPLLRPDC